MSFGSQFSSKCCKSITSYTCKLCYQYQQLRNSKFQESFRTVYTEILISLPCSSSLFLHTQRLSMLTQVITLQPYIWEIPSLNVGWDSGYPDRSSSVPSIKWQDTSFTIHNSLAILPFDVV